MNSLDTLQTKPIEVKASVMGNGTETLISGELKDGKFVAIAPHDSDNVVFMGVSEGNSVINRIMGFDINEIKELLIRAVNNRTRQRNYFRLYSQMLEKEISEDCFYKILDEHEDDFVISEAHKPTKEQVMLALKLSAKIKDVENSEELADLFSFDSAETDRHLVDIEKYECVQ